MKKSLIHLLVLFSFLSLSAYAEDFYDEAGLGDMTQNYATMDNAYNGQKKVTDEEFQKALEEVKARQNKKKKINQPFKGKNMNEESSGTYLEETAEKNLLLGVPLVLVGDDGEEIPIGHYKVVGEKIKNKIYLNFYQSYTLVSRLSAIETREDFSESAINFVKLIPYNEQKIKLIYGSLDFNAYTFIDIKDGISDLN